MLLVATCFIILKIIVNIEAKENNPRSVQVALETVLAFNDRDNTENLKFIDNLQDFLTKVKKTVVKQGKTNFQRYERPQRKFMQIPDLTFTEFTKELIKILKTYQNNDLEDVFAVFDNEIRKYNYEGCKFDELVSNQNVLKYVARILEPFRNQPAETIKYKLNKMVQFLEDAKMDLRKSALHYVDSLFTKQDAQKFRNVLNYFERYKMKSRKTNIDLTQIIKKTLRSVIFDHYSNLSVNIRRDLKSMLEKLVWNGLNRINDVHHVEWNIENTQTPTDQDKTTTSKNIKLNLNMQNQFDIASLELLAHTETDKDNIHIEGQKLHERNDGDVQTKDDLGNGGDSEATGSEKYSSSLSDDSEGFTIGISPYSAEIDYTTKNRHHKKQIFTPPLHMDGGKNLHTPNKSYQYKKNKINMAEYLDDSSKYRAYKDQHPTNDNISGSGSNIKQMPDALGTYYPVSVTSNPARKNKYKLKTATRNRTSKMNTSRQEQFSMKKHHKKRNRKGTGKTLFSDNTHTDAHVIGWPNYLRSQELSDEKKPLTKNKVKSKTKTRYTVSSSEQEALRFKKRDDKFRKLKDTFSIKTHLKTMHADNDDYLKFRLSNPKITNKDHKSFEKKPKTFSRSKTTKDVTFRKPKTVKVTLSERHKKIESSNEEVLKEYSKNHVKTRSKGRPKKIIDTSTEVDTVKPGKEEFRLSNKILSVKNYSKIVKNTTTEQKKTMEKRISYKSEEETTGVEMHTSAMNEEEYESNDRKIKKSDKKQNRLKNSQQLRNMQQKSIRKSVEEYILTEKDQPTSIQEYERDRKLIENDERTTSTKEIESIKTSKEGIHEILRTRKKHAKSEKSSKYNSTNENFYKKNEPWDETGALTEENEPVLKELYDNLSDLYNSSNQKKTQKKNTYTPINIVSSERNKHVKKGTINIKPDKIQTIQNLKKDVSSGNNLNDTEESSEHKFTNAMVGKSTEEQTLTNDLEEKALICSEVNKATNKEISKMATRLENNLIDKSFKRINELDNFPQFTLNTSLTYTTNFTKSTRSFLQLSDFILHQPIKININVMTSNQPNITNRDFRKRNVGNMAKIKRLNKLYKTLYAMDNTSPETTKSFIWTTTDEAPAILKATTSLSTKTLYTTTTSTAANSSSREETSLTSQPLTISTTKKTRRKKKKRRRTTISVEPLISDVTTIALKPTTTTLEATSTTLDPTTTPKLETSTEPIITIRTSLSIKQETTDYRRNNDHPKFGIAPTNNFMDTNKIDNYDYTGGNYTHYDYEGVNRTHDRDIKEMYERFEINLDDTKRNETSHALLENKAIAGSVKPKPFNVDAELKAEKSRLQLNKDMMKVFGKTISIMDETTIPANTLYTDPFDVATDALMFDLI